MAENRDAVALEVSHEPVPSAERYGLLWIDSERATIQRWRGRVVTEKLVSDAVEDAVSVAAMILLAETVVTESVQDADLALPAGRSA